MDDKVSRRDLFKVFGVAGAGIALSGCAAAGGNGAKPDPVAKKKVMKEVKARSSNAPVIWIQGQSCSGCSVSLLNGVHPEIVELLTDFINLEFHQTVMAGTGDVAIDMLRKALKEQKGEFYLVVEGSIPVEAHGHYCSVGENDGKPWTMLDLTKALGKAAKATIAVGACATYGGIPAGEPNPTGAKAFSEIMPKATLINVPGCPSHPDWIAGTIAHVLLFGIPELDGEKRPKMFFGKTIHEQCERRGYFDDDEMAEHFSDEGCLFELGCKGPEAYCDAAIRSWNAKTNWCVQAGGPCIGCTEPSFPDHSDGLYGALPESLKKDLRKQSAKKANV